MYRTSFLTLALLALTSCAPPPPVSPTVDLAAEERAVRDDTEMWSKHALAKDLAGFTMHYASDAVVMIPHMPALKGIDNIKKSLEAMLADPNFKLEFSADSVMVAKSGDMATVSGPYTATATDPKKKKPMTENGRFVTVYKKMDGKWLAVQDINTPESPMP